MFIVMINEKCAKKFCCEDISLIENYELAINSPERWDCHHRLETELGLSRQELKDTGRYYNIEAKYLIFLEASEHTRLHKKGHKHSLEQRIKNSDAHKGNKFAKGCHHSDESKAIISLKNRGKKYRLGKHFSDESKMKLRMAHLGKKKVWNDESHTKFHFEFINEESIFYSPLF